MAKSVYYKGMLLNIKDWDYGNSRPKSKETKQLETEIIIESEEEVIEE